MSGFFSALPDTVRLPFTYTEFDPSHADTGPYVMPYTVLLAGQMLPGGKAEALTLQRPMSAAQADIMFGQGSQLAQMAAAYLNANPVTKMLAIGIHDFAGGTQARGALSISGQVSIAAPICLYIGGILVRLRVSSGENAGAVSSRLRDLVNSRPDLPVTAADSGSSIEFIARHKGEGGNDIDIRLFYAGEDRPGGLDFAITPMGGGSGNPDVADLIAAWGGRQFHVIAWPWRDRTSLAALKTEMDERWGPLRQIDGQVVVVKPGSFVETVTFSASKNDKHLTVIPSEGSPTLSWADCAASVGVIAYYGQDDPARPFQTLTIPGVRPPLEPDRWANFPERNQALFEGCSTRDVTPAGEVMFTNLITTYRQNNWGGETQAYLSLNTPLTLSYLRWDWNNYIKLKYPRHKLADDALSRRVAPGQPIMTPKQGKAEAIVRYKVWEERGLVEAPDGFAKNTIVQRDAVNRNRLNWLIPPDLVNQFQVAATSIRFVL